MKRVLLLLGMMFSLTAVMAEENVLQTIEIEPVKDTYNIVLVSDKVVDVKKTVEDSNRITLTMKNIRASKLTVALAAFSAWKKILIPFPCGSTITVSTFDTLL